MIKESKLSNYIPINRKLFHHHLWKEQRTYSRFEAWLDLLQAARFEDTEAKMLIGCKMVKWVRSQLPASLRYLSARWQWSTKKVSSFIDLLESELMIHKETVKETGQTIITICNYDTYNTVIEKKKQQKKQEGNSEETPGKQQGNKSNKEEDNKERKESVPHTPEEIDLFKSFEDWMNKYSPRISQMKEPLTISEYLNLRKKIPKEIFKSVLQAMQNKSTLLKDYVSANLTIQSWVEIRKEKGQSKFFTDSDKDETKAKSIIDGVN